MTDAGMDRVLEGVDASRRAAWRAFYEMRDDRDALEREHERELERWKAVAVWLVVNHLDNLDLCGICDGDLATRLDNLDLIAANQPFPWNEMFDEVAIRARQYEKQYGTSA